MKLRKIFVKTYTNQSIAKSNVTSCVGAPIADNTISIITSAADGTDDVDIEAANDKRQTAKISPILNSMPFIWAIKIDAIEIYKAVPSILILHPIGRTNFVILESMLTFVSSTRNVNGSAAALENLMEVKKKLIKQILV